ncbi:hypothetical protein AS200_03590 [Streptomyces sp. CdTB01]|nr:hypothetical protein AS200_03590 [Streptomyces sp. CdTB01]
MLVQGMPVQGARPAGFELAAHEPRVVIAGLWAIARAMASRCIGMTGVASGDGEAFRGGQRHDIGDAWSWDWP